MGDVFGGIKCLNVLDCELADSGDTPKADGDACEGGCVEGVIQVQLRFKKHDDG